MATLTSTACQTSSGGFFLNPPKYIENGMVVRSATYSFTANQSAGDIVQMVPIPKGAQIAALALQIDGKAAGADIVCQVGDGGSATRFLTSVSGSAVAQMVGGLGYSYSAEDTIDVKVSSVTSATAGGSIRLTVSYTMDQSTDGVGS